MKKILIIEDDNVLRGELKILLGANGYEAEEVTDFEDAAGQVLAAEREIRAKSDVPVIMLTSRNEDVDEIVSRSSGADDYVTKPYNPTLLLLRIETVLRRTGGQPREKELSYRGMRLNVLRSSIFYKGEEHVLSHNEMTILHCLVKNRGRIVSRDELMDYLWDNSEFVDDNTLTVNINRLRKRLDGIGMGDVIETRRRQGYILM